MRFLHTSDWHLGRSFHREGMLGAQAAFVDHLIEVVRAERVDAVLVSGDVYDRALPPVDAVALFDETLLRLRAERVRVVLISGNHDSAQRLGFGAGLMDSSDVHVRTDPDGVGRPVPLGENAIAYPIPYLEPVTVGWELPERGHAAVLGEAMRRVRADLAGRPGTRSVVLAHAFVTGGEASDSERDISVGGVARVPTSVFDGVDYVALGHLHGSQCLTETVRYSGSPLAYSFSEEHQTKGMWLVSTAGGVAAEFVPAPVPRPIARLRGTLEDLLSDPRWAGYEDHWLQVTLTDPVRPLEPMGRLRARFPHVLSLVPEHAGAGGEDWVRRAATARAPLDVAADFVATVRGGLTAGEAELALLQEAVEQCRTEA
jgi:exonuclease SbcD